MKQILISFFFALWFTSAIAQVKIGGTPVAPVPSAVLELDGGNNRGLLLPRMRKLDIDAIVNPAEGLTIYATDQQAVYLRRSGSWVKMNGNSDAFSLPYINSFSAPGGHVLWLNNVGGDFGTAIQGSSTGNGYGVRGFTATGIGTSGVSTELNGLGGYFGNSGGGRSLVSMDKTGIGTNSPDVLLHVDGTSSTGNTIIIDDDADPTIQFRKAGINKSYIKQQGNDLVFRPNDNNFAGKVILQAYNQGGWMFVDADGNASLGQDPATFNGTPNNVRMHIKSTNKNVLTLESANNSGTTLSFQDKIGNNFNSSAAINSNATAFTMSSGGARRYDWTGESVYGGNIAMSLRKVEDPFTNYHLGVMGKIGAGTLDPEAALHIYDGLQKSTTVIVEGDIPPVVSFRITGVEKGFIQQQENEFKIGTVATNERGRFVVRTGGLDRLWVDSVGYVTIGGRIGPTISGPYRLAVRGKIAATDFNVVASGSWPDYVFSPSYKLRSLEETEAYINEHKHLPNIPAAAIVDKEGFALGDMQKRMMEKVEELTLYLIEANKNIQRQQKEIDQLKNQLIVLQGNK